jgi:hypothetical protein
MRGGWAATIVQRPLVSRGDRNVNVASRLRSFVLDKIAPFYPNVFRVRCERKQPNEIVNVRWRQDGTSTAKLRMKQSRSTADLPRATHRAKWGFFVVLCLRGHQSARLHY